MKKLSGLLLLFAALLARAQSGEVTVLDFVKVKDNHYKEALYFYEHNWKVYRDEALKAGVIRRYQLLQLAPDTLQHFDLLLVTVFNDSSQYKNSEAAFAPIIRLLRPNGPLLLNALKPADFRQNLYAKTASTLFFSTKED